MRTMDRCLPVYKDLHTIHHYPLGIMHETFLQYFQLAVKIKQKVKMQIGSQCLNLTHILALIFYPY